jgi:hypothetical protein
LALATFLPSVADELQRRSVAYRIEHLTAEGRELESEISAVTRTGAPS